MIKNKFKKGFTLIELLVALGIFSLVMTVSLGAVLLIFDANKKSQTLKTVVDNLNFALESMSRDFRFGSNYSCEGVGDCPSGGSSVTVKKEINGESKIITYSLSDGRILKKVGDDSAIPITSPEIFIDELSFTVSGSDPSDVYQPRIFMVIRGVVGVSSSVSSDFSLQTQVSQRCFDNGLCD